MPSVATNEEIPTIATITPLNAPIAHTTASVRMMLGYSGNPGVMELVPDERARTGRSAPIDRSISPRIITNTSPAAMIAYGAKYGSRVLKFATVTKLLVVATK